MTIYRAAVIGCGNRGNRHAPGYVESPDAQLVACVDILEEARTTFAAVHGVPRTYVDYREMLAQERPDLVSICTWTGLHPQMVIDVARSGVKAIHSEKPMAPTWGEAKAMYAACQENDVVLTFCHQRRFESCFITAKRLLDEGAIGDLRRMEAVCSNLFDWGTHWFDMLFFFNNEEPVEWVMGQIDVAGARQVFGVPVEGSGLSWFRYQNGVEGLLTTGDASAVGPRAHIRLLGSEGIIDIQGGNNAPVLLGRIGSDGWEEVPAIGGVSSREATPASIQDLIDALKEGREPMLAGRKALQATELIFATYESSRRRAKIVLPLDVDDSALIAMLGETIVPPRSRFG